MKKIFQAIQFLTVFSVIGTYLICSFILRTFVRDKWKKTKLTAQLNSYSCRIMLKVMGVDVNVVGQVPPLGSGQLMVSNHLTYLDIIVVNSQIPTCFVTSVEIRETPVLGAIVEAAACLFVERRNKKNLSKEVAELTEGLKNDVNITIFPEATSTNGEQVLRFRRPLYRSALDAQVPVLPICINYRTIGGEKVSLKNRDKIYWYGDMTFVDHLWELIGLGRVNVDLHVLGYEPVQSSDTETELAERTHLRVSQTFQPCLN